MRRWHRLTQLFGVQLRELAAQNDIKKAPTSREAGGWNAGVATRLVQLTTHLLGQESQHCIECFANPGMLQSHGLALE
jgi:hypothetical protein